MSAYVRVLATMTLLATDVNGRVLDLARGKLTAEDFLAAPRVVAGPGTHDVANEKSRDCVEEPDLEWSISDDGNLHRASLLSRCTIRTPVVVPT